MIDHAEDWYRDKKYVEEELKRISAICQSTNNEISYLRTEIGKLQIKSGVWGAIGGIFPVALVILLKLKGYG